MCVFLKASCDLGAILGIPITAEYKEVTVWGSLASGTVWKANGGVYHMSAWKKWFKLGSSCTGARQHKVMSEDPVQGAFACWHVKTE